MINIREKASKLKKVFCGRYWLVVYYIVTIAYLELLYRLLCYGDTGFDYFFAFLFAFPSGAVLFLITGLFISRVNRILGVLFTVLLSLVYETQMIYYHIFHTPLTIYSLSGAGEALQFGNIALESAFGNATGVILLFLPVFFISAAAWRLTFDRMDRNSIFSSAVLFTAGYTAAILCLRLSGTSMLSPYDLYRNYTSPGLTVRRLGVMTAMDLEVKRIIGDSVNKAWSSYRKSERKNGSSVTCNASAKSPSPSPSGLPDKKLNVLNIDFDAMIAGEKDPDLADMHRYFSSVAPTETNKYTGRFKGDNLILITAEAFSPYAVSPELTPVLFKMATEGFVFRNFYNPVWSVSTSDGEYVVCTGLLPKSGIWSFYRSAKNELPFAMGNQLNKLGYITKAYHNHTYDYYRRDVSHPNMGYEYKAVGNGLKMKNTWPESDLEMIEATADEYIGSKPFHTYYMTVSGHMNYSFNGNFISYKNRQLTSGMPYSEEARAYIACNLELEFAMKALIDKLEAAGIADKTVIAISPDHYPYGLPKESIDELAGHRVESNFELYKSTFILWKKGIKKTVINKPCSSLDVLPTLSNLFGLEYDSRLLMGRDILSNDPPLVIFSNRSWLTDRARYNSLSNRIVFYDDALSEAGYEDAINTEVAHKFKYSEKVLDTDYYSRILPAN